jgi:hypothetical protein
MNRTTIEIAIILTTWSYRTSLAANFRFKKSHLKLKYTGNQTFGAPPVRGGLTTYSTGRAGSNLFIILSAAYIECRLRRAG